MAQRKYLLLLTLLVLPFLSAVLDVPLGSEQCLCPVDAADSDRDAGEDEPSPLPSSSYRWLKGAPKLRVDLPAGLFVTRYPIPHHPSYAFGYVGYASAASVYHDAPLYQALQVYRC